MNSQPFRRFHLLQASLLGLGVSLEEIASFRERFEALVAGSNLLVWWDTPLDSQELDLLTQLLSDNRQLCQSTLNASFQRVSENTPVTVAELWSWTGALTGNAPAPELPIQESATSF